MNHFDSIVNCCRDLLLNFPQAKEVADYADSRLSREGQQKFSFGYFPTQEQLDILINSVGEECLSKAELIYHRVSQDNTKTTYAPMKYHNLIMPYRDLYGNIIAIVGRSILDDEEREIHNIPKYKNTSFAKGNHLFGLYEAKRSIIKNNVAYIVEGQFDCITAHDKGLSNVVALGSSNMSFEQFSILSRYTNNVILLLDNDDAGRIGCERIINQYAKHANIKKAVIPKGYKDIDEYLTDNTVDSFNYAIK